MEPARIVGLDHVQIAIPRGGEERARSFYRDLLGLEEVAKPAVLAANGGCWFRGPGVELHLGVEDDFRPARKAHVALRVGDLDALERRMHEAGIALNRDTRLADVRRSYADDPFGNRVEFVAAER